MSDFPDPPASLDSRSIPTAVTDLIFNLKIKDVMTANLVTAGKGDTLRSIQLRMKEENITGIPIVENKRLLGLVSMHDILTAFDNGTIDEPVEKHMSRDIKVLEDDMPLTFAVNYFSKFGFGRFPVLNKKRELAGIITMRDINTTLLKEVHRVVEELENEIQKGVRNDSEDDSRQYSVVRHDFENAGKASTDIKKCLKKHGFDPKLIRRVAVAAYEMEMNLVVHSSGGRMIFRMDENQLVLTTVDTGPGIPDTDKVLEVGYTTANDWIRSLGFGAGMGLPNIQRVSDSFSISSVVGEGTTVEAVFQRAEAV